MYAGHQVDNAAPGLGKPLKLPLTCLRCPSAVTLRTLAVGGCDLRRHGHSCPRTDTALDLRPFCARSLAACSPVAAPVPCAPPRCSCGLGTTSLYPEDRDGLRFCPDCNDYLVREDFYGDPRTKNGSTRRCRKHHSWQSYESRKKTPASFATASTTSDLWLKLSSLMPITLSSSSRSRETRATPGSETRWWTSFGEA